MRLVFLSLLVSCSPPGAVLVSTPAPAEVDGDGYHDTWQIAGQNPDTPQLQRIEIYDRFSKLLYILNKNTSGWNGTYNGKQMPSSDYWFKAIFKNDSTYRGHFTLKR